MPLEPHQSTTDGPNKKDEQPNRPKRFRIPKVRISTRFMKQFKPLIPEAIGHKGNKENKVNED